MVSLACVGIMIIKGLIYGEFVYSGALLIGAIFLPSAALFFGIYSGSKKLFEVLYLMAWYVGSVDKLYAVDLLATNDLSISSGKMFVLAILIVGFLILSFVKRKADLIK